MTPQNPDSQEAPSSEADAESPEPERAVSKTKLYIAVAVMLLPAAVPLYFALGTEGTAAILLVAAAGFVALTNTLMVYGIWRWLNSMQASASHS